MKKTLTAVFATMLFASCAKEGVRQEQLAIAKGSEDCSYEVLLSKVRGQADCEVIRSLIEPCAEFFCSDQLAVLMATGDSAVVENTNPPCEWSWLPPGLPCE